MLKVNKRKVEGKLEYEWGYLCKDKVKKVIDFRIKFVDDDNHHIELYIETSIGYNDLQDMIINREETFFDDITDFLYCIDGKCMMFNNNLNFDYYKDLIIKLTRMTTNLFKINIKIKYYNIEYYGTIDIKHD